MKLLLGALSASICWSLIGAQPDWVLALMPQGGSNSGTTTTPRPIELQPNFSLSRYAGRWFEIFRARNTPFQNGTDTTAFYTLLPNGTIHVQNNEWHPDQWQWSNPLPGQANVKNPNRPAALVVQFPGSPPGDYQVLYTDYDTVSVVYSIYTWRGTTLQYGWVLARRPYLDDATLQRVWSVYREKTGLTPDFFVKTRHGVAPFPGGRDNAKCWYKVPARSCGWYFGSFIVYDSNTRKCGYLHTACSIGDVWPYSFGSPRECFAACMTMQKPWD